jgi:hypothetical protein
MLSTKQLFHNLRISLILSFSLQESSCCGSYESCCNHLVTNYSQFDTLNRIAHFKANPSLTVYPPRILTIMSKFVSFLLVSVLFGLSHGFVMPPSLVQEKSVTRNDLQHKISIAHLSPVDFLETTSNLLANVDASDYIPGTSGEVTYSRASYYVILGLYLTSFPGLWSVIKRSTSAKIKRKTYVSKGGNDPEGKALRVQAGEIMAYMKANNYEVVDAGETITFRGIVQRSTSQAFFLVFCAAVGLASLALVLQIQFQSLGKYFESN